jgi:hypothetical protein
MMEEVVEKQKKSINDLSDAALVELYIKLRDRRSARKREYEVDDASDKAKQEKIEGHLLKRFNESGAESVRTAHGTAYKETKTSVTCPDRESFFDFIREHELFDLLEARPSKSTVQQYFEAHGEYPPGLNINRAVTITVRRS